MPWSNRKYGRVICDACDWASKRKDLTGYRDVLTIGGYLRRKVDPERIYCPQCVLTHADAAGGRDALHMTEVKALEERAFHWFPTEDLAEAQDVAAQDAAEGSWTLAVGADERDTEKAEMLRRIQRLESTEEHLSDRVSNLETKLQEVMDRLETLRVVVMGGSHAQGT